MADLPIARRGGLGALGGAQKKITYALRADWVPITLNFHPAFDFEYIYINFLNETKNFQITSVLL